MGAFKADRPRANPPICWRCDRRLYGAGKFYVMAEVDGVMRPVHTTLCETEATWDDDEVES